MDELSQPAANDVPLEQSREHVSQEPPDAMQVERLIKFTELPDVATPRSTSSLHKLTWLMTVMALLLASTWVVPYFVEEFHYAKERGRQRAQVDMAPVALKNLGLEELSRAYQLVSQRVGPSVVHLNVAEGESAANENPDAKLFGPGNHGFTGQGSGVVVDASGYILTNRHVVLGAREIEVALSDGRHVKARVVGLDRPTDLALLKIDADKLIVAEWGDSEAIEVGALVWAIGSPFGFERSITSGILSAKHRAGKAGTTFQDLMQTDAAVNPGNSGGPLVDVSGRVIGINTAIVGPSYQGISFAIPSSVAREVYDRLKSAGHVTRGWLGVEMDAVSEKVAKDLGLDAGTGVLVKGHVHVVERRNKRTGLMETDVVADSAIRAGDNIVQRSPAQQAGLQAGDVIQNWDGTDVANPDSLLKLVAKTLVGNSAQVAVRRGGQTVTVAVELGERPAEVETGR